MCGVVVMTVNYTAFFFTKAPTGHGWTGDYDRLAYIFCASAYKHNITPIHIHLPDDKLICPSHFTYNPIGVSGLVYIRELAYLAFLKKFDHEVVLCDIDQVFARTIPSIKEGFVARLVNRIHDQASFNGPRIVNKGAIPILQGTVQRMEMMADEYKRWDGDSLAFADSVREAMYKGTKVEFVPEYQYNSRPSLFLKPVNELKPFMFHFKGKEGKQEMIDYGKKVGLI